MFLSVVNFSGSRRTAEPCDCRPLFFRHPFATFLGRKSLEEIREGYRDRKEAEKDRLREGDVRDHGRSGQKDQQKQRPDPPDPIDEAKKLADRERREAMKAISATLGQLSLDELWRVAVQLPEFVVLIKVAPARATNEESAASAEYTDERIAA